MHHRLLDDYVDPWVGDIIPTLATDFHMRMYLCYNGGDVYLGPWDRIEEVRKWTLTY